MYGRERHIQESSCSEHRTPNLEIWKCGSAAASAGTSLLTFVCGLSPLVWLVDLSMSMRLERRRVKGAYREQPRVFKGDFSEKCIKYSTFQKNAAQTFRLNGAHPIIL